MDNKIIAAVFSLISDISSIFSEKYGILDDIPFQFVQSLLFGSPDQQMNIDFTGPQLEDGTKIILKGNVVLWDENKRAYILRASLVNKKDSSVDETIIEGMVTSDGKVIKTDGNDAPISNKKQEKIIPKDLSRYSLNGLDWYSKAKIAYVGIKRYIDEHPGITIKELKKVFNDDVQGHFGCIQSFEQAKKCSDYEKRFHCKEKWIIHMESGDYVVCSQWEKKNIDKLLDVLRSVGYTVEVRIR